MNDEDWKKVAERHLGKHIEYVNGWADCEERIIALLKNPATKDAWIHATRNTFGTYGNTVEYLIRAIKGEAK